MTDHSPEQTNPRATDGQSKKDAIHAWWERNKTRNSVFVIAACLGLVVLLGELVSSVETMWNLIVSQPTATVTEARLSNLAQKSNSLVTSQADQSAYPPVQVLLLDGATVTLDWRAQLQVMPKDAPVYAVEFNGMRDAQAQVVAAFTSSLLRRAAALEKKEMLILRPQMEKEIGDELRREFSSRGVTVQTISLGEIREN